VSHCEQGLQLFNHAGERHLRLYPCLIDESLKAISDPLKAGAEKTLFEPTFSSGNNTATTSQVARDDSILSRLSHDPYER
jgi:hypothetical protein